MLRLMSILSGSALEQRCRREDLARLRGDRAPTEDGPGVLLVNDGAGGLVKMRKDLVFGSPVIKDLVLATSMNTFAAEGPQPPPTASATMGVKEKPSLMQALRVSRYEFLKSS
jgi:hypothetical protein